MREHEFAALGASLDRSHFWPRSPERGALNFLTSEAVRRSIDTVATGTVISCADRQAALRVLGRAGPHHALQTHTETAGNWLAVNEEVSYQQHGPGALTHIDSFGHFFYRGRGFGGTTTDVISANGVSANDVVASSAGIVGRGLLVDLPRIIGGSYVPPDRLVQAREVQSWLDQTGTTVRSGDLLFVRTGRTHSPPPEAEQFFNTGGLDLDCAQWMHDSEFSLIVSDAGMDVPRTIVENVPVPWHILTLTRLGLCLVDSANLDALAAACAAQQRTTFLAVIAPLPLTGATASPVNPIAIL